MIQPRPGYLGPITALAAFASLFAFGLHADETKTQGAVARNRDLPEAFEQIIPRGRIASIDAPTFVSASEAELPDDAWILGIEIDGQARAYSLNLLNHHEVVNDRVGDLSFAAVW